MKSFTSIVLFSIDGYGKVTAEAPRIHIKDRCSVLISSYQIKCILDEANTIWGSNEQNNGGLTAIPG